MSETKASNVTEIHAGDRYLSFSLGQEDYAVPLLDVKEVIAMPDVTPIPFTPPHFLGIMNLRGQVISVLDLRTKMGIKPSGSGETAVIICDLASVSLGIVVDSINSVIAPSSSELSDKPEMIQSKNSDYISGVYRDEKKLVLLIDIAKALGVEDLAVAARNGKSAAAA